HKGPKVSAPEQAIEGFCRANNITSSDLSVKEIKGSEFYIYEQNIKEQSTKDILAQTIDQPISEYVWPKSMYWGDYKIKWVRPLKNILCIFDGEVVPFEYGHLVANNKAYGHRFMSAAEQTVNGFDDYKKKLTDNFVVLDAAERRDLIQSGLIKQANQLGLVLKEDSALLEEVSGLVEYPEVLLGKIEERFLSVPSEVLVSAMRGHQKYFSLFDKDGKFAPYFLFVSNIKSVDSQIVISGNEKVLSARLADALYFYNQDLKTTLSDKAKRLDQVIFHAKLGSLGDKTNRLAAIAGYIDPSNKDAASAALLCKSDIVSEVVDEFPNLQGIMGYYYAKADGLNDEIAIAVRDHYKPQGPSDDCPKGAAAILALSDKIDSLCGLMLTGEKPSGSKDPYALRRQALGIVRIILENKINIDLVSLVKFTAAQYKGRVDIDPKIIDQIINFLEDRFKHCFKDQYKTELISTVLDLNHEADLLETKSKLLALDKFLTSADGGDLLNSYKRASNILGNDNVSVNINESLFGSKEESELFAAITNCHSKVEVAINSKNYSEALKALASLQAPVSSFFENVMVKDKDADIAQNRLALLAKMRLIFDKIAKFGKL
ncbi:glycine--tRNA ligase subunit beta, partial [Rickettsiaceae bacterium]|nr:glycine--tRNA ligase subunit beta [Rickettsiaceae bacterium]